VSKRKERTMSTSGKLPNIAIVVLDAARAGNFPQYGYGNDTTPRMGRVLEGFTTYLNAISSSYWTFPSITSLFTGTYLSRHGCTIDGDKLPGRFITLPGYLADMGYDTAGFSSNPYVSDYTGLDRGFAHFTSRFYRSVHLDRLFRTLLKKMKGGGAGDRGQDGSEETSEQRVNWTVATGKRKPVSPAKRWLKYLLRFDKGARFANHAVKEWLSNRRNQEKPFFLYLHYEEPHTPYSLPHSYLTRFFDKEMRARGSEAVNQDSLRYHLNEEEMSPLDFAMLGRMYDGAIAYLDHMLFQLYTFLERQGLVASTLIIITADHGDNLGEHGLLFHRWCLYDTLVKVPLFIKLPKDVQGGGGGREEGLVQNVDIFPTIVDMLEGKVSHPDHEQLLAQLQGNSLLSERIRNRPDDLAVSELLKPFGPDALPYRDQLVKFDRKLLALRTKERKFIHSSEGDHELYELESDPGEEHNLYQEKEETFREFMTGHQDRVDAFQDMMDRLGERVYRFPDGMVEGELEERLKALGYL